MNSLQGNFSINSLNTFLIQNLTITIHFNKKATCSPQTEQNHKFQAYKSDIVSKSRYLENVKIFFLDF